MNKRRISTTNEFVYDVLNNMIHHNEIILDKKDIANSKALKNIVSRFKDTFSVEDGGDHIILHKTGRFDADIRYKRL